MPQHLALPFRVTGSGRLATVDQDSEADVAQSIALLLDTRPGERRSVPDYGLPDPLFGGVDAGVVADVILTWEEERADGIDVEQIAQGVIDSIGVLAQPAPGNTTEED